jgi:hypothetical protein
MHAPRCKIHVALNCCCTCVCVALYLPKTFYSDPTDDDDCRALPPHERLQNSALPVCELFTCHWGGGICGLMCPTTMQLHHATTECAQKCVQFNLTSAPKEESFNLFCKYVDFRTIYLKKINRHICVQPCICVCNSATACCGHVRNAMHAQPRMQKDFELLQVNFKFWH